MSWPDFFAAKQPNHTPDSFFAHMLNHLKTEGDCMLISLTTAFLCGAAFCILRVSSPSGSFPRPLSAEQEATCIAAMRGGDSQARDMLIEHNLRLVAHIVKKYYASSSDTDDLISIGTIGLIKGVSTFDPNKNVRLATYISRCIENPIHSPMRLFLLIGRLFPSFLKHNTYYATQANAMCGMHLYVFTASLSLHLES